jgi:lysozyme family protein
MKRTFDELFQGVIKHEGYYANVKGDRGGETYMGIARNLHPNWRGWDIIDQYREVVKFIRRNTKIENSELTKLVKDFYYATFYKAYNIDKINSGSLQEIIFDWCVNSGRWGSKGVQKVLNSNFNAGLVRDGILGQKTIAAINQCKPEQLFIAIKESRINYYKRIAKIGENEKFLNGWLKRINAIDFTDT